jgi:hypothetical protein
MSEQEVYLHARAEVMLSGKNGIRKTDPVFCTIHMHMKDDESVTPYDLRELIDALVAQVNEELGIPQPKPDPESPPQAIYLQWHNPLGVDGSVTWCADKINNDDVMYWRAPNDG